MVNARRSLLRAVLWWAFGLLTLALASGLPRQSVDPRNQALKTPRGPEADRLRALAEIVPSDPVVLLAFAAAGELPILAADRERLRTLVDGFRSLPGVIAVHEAAVPDPGLALFPVAIAGDDLAATAADLVEHARRGCPATLRAMATGLPLLESTIADLVAGERLTIVPMLVGVLFVAALVFYRRVRWAVAVLLPPLAGIAWTGGMLAWLGHRLDPIAALLDPVLLTIGVAASVHFLEAFRAGLARGESPPVAADAAAAALRTPALLATATTMIGLWSLATSDTPAVHDFGCRSAFGVGLTHLFGFLLLPAWLGAGAAPAMPLAPAGGAWPSIACAWLLRLVRHRTAWLVLTAIVSTLALAGLLRLRTDNDPLRLLPGNVPARVDHDVLAQRLGGVETCHLLVPARSGAADPTRLLPLLAEIRRTPGFAGLAGPVQRGTTGDLAVPLLLTPGGTALREHAFATCERLAAVLGLDGVTLAGESVRTSRDSHRLMHGLVGSLGLSLLLLGVGIAIGLRSVRLAALGLVPNLLPSMWLYGCLGWLDRPVSVATAMIGCTMLGLIVDNTLHLLHHYRMERRTHSRHAAMHLAFGRCRRPMTLASVVLMTGFLTAATSRLATTVEFGLLAAATIAFAWFGTVVVLPLLFLSPEEPQADPAWLASRGTR